MDLDGPQNDKGMYALAPVKPQMSIRNEDVIPWSHFRGQADGQIRVGFMSQVSPDGQYVVTTIKGRRRQNGSLNNFYVANFKDYRFLQVFYPTRGILAWYEPRDRQAAAAARRRRPALRADQCASGAPTASIWSLPAPKPGTPIRQGSKMAEFANDPNEMPIQYDLYRIPFNDGKGGQPEPIAGASQNGMSNTFPKVSPDGRWIVFVQCRNGQLMRPDSQLYIVPAAGRRGAADALQHAADELLAQLFAQRPLAGVFLQEPLALHADVPHAHRRRRQRQPGDPDRELHGGQPRGEHSGVRQHSAGRLGRRSTCRPPNSTACTTSRGNWRRKARL